MQPSSVQPRFKRDRLGYALPVAGPNWAHVKLGGGSHYEVLPLQYWADEDASCSWQITPVKCGLLQ